MKQIKYFLLLIMALVGASCSDDDATPDSRRFISLSVSMPDGESTTRVGASLSEGSKDLSVSFKNDDEFSIYVRQGAVIQEIENVIFAINGGNNKNGTLKFEMPASVNMNKTYTLYGICGTHSRINDGRLVVEGNSKIETPIEFQAPVWFDYTGQAPPSTIQCQYIGTFIVIHINNQSATDNLFQIWGVISDALYDDLYWDENTKTFSEDFGVSPVSSAVPVAAGGKAVFIYNGIPNGKTMETINISMHIDKEITWNMDMKSPAAPKTVGKTLKQGKAYHVYLTWDGKELKWGGQESLPSENVETFKVNGVSFDMVKVEGGTFIMGTPENDEEQNEVDLPRHKVTLSTFYIGRTEVTRALWYAVMGGYQVSDDEAMLPIDQISWNDSHDFIKELNSKTGRHFRLPTEAEWEYAARGGKYSKGYTYSGSNDPDEVAWHYYSTPRLAGGAFSGEIQKVATKKPNELGIYDMSGNVFEWCQDLWSPTYYSESPQYNPQGPTTGQWPVRRGGCAINGVRFCKSYFRNYLLVSTDPFSYRSYDHGFRLVMDY